MYSLAKYGDPHKISQATDVRHIFWMWDVLRRSKAKRALEIGCLHGATTTAFAEAVNAGHPVDVHLCDPQFTPELYRVASQFRRAPTLHQMPSAELLAQTDPFDFVYVDGDHRLEAVTREIELLFAKDPPMCVFAHDAGWTAEKFPEWDGAGSAHLRQVFEASEVYHVIVDEQQRDGEYTERGMMMATRDSQLAEIGRLTLHFWANYPRDLLEFKVYE